MLASLADGHLTTTQLFRQKENAPRSLSVATILGEIPRLAGGKSLAEAFEELLDRHQ